MANQNSEQERRRLAQLYASMADGELEKLAREAATLSDVARGTLKAELSRRGLCVALQDAPAAKKEEAEKRPKIVTLRRYTSVQEALFAKSVLDSAGIECFLADENTIRMDWFWSNAIGGIKLWVKQEDAAAAEAILDQRRPAAFDVEGVGAYKQPQCPRCHSSDVSFRGLNRRVAYGSMLLVGLPMPLKHTGWTCNACGHTWGDVNDPPREIS
jgi:hypothetical protein